MRDVVDLGIRAGEEQALVTVVVPPHEVGRTTALAVYLKDLRIPIRLSDMVTLDHESITDFRVHVITPLVLVLGSNISQPSKSGIAQSRRSSVARRRQNSADRSVGPARRGRSASPR